MVYDGRRRGLRGPDPYPLRKMHHHVSEILYYCMMLRYDAENVAKEKSVNLKILEIRKISQGVVINP